MTVIFAPIVLTWSLLSAPATGSTSQPDEHTVALLHLDGTARDAGPAGNDGEVRPPVTWSEGRFGQAASLDGQGGIVIPASGTAHVGSKSWTVECWFLPAESLPDHAVLVSGGWGHERHWFLRISERKHLVACFSMGSRTATVSSPDLSAAISDGRWHHVAAVLDRARHGEVRLYFDGNRVPVEPAFCPPIVFDDEQMGIAIGSITPWSIGKDGYRGRIDEIHISDIVRPAYAVEGSPPAAGVTGLDRPTLPRDPAFAQGPLPLTPKTTLLVLAEHGSGEAIRLGAMELQRRLRAAHGVDGGFEIVPEEKLDSIQGKAVIALGRSQWADGERIECLSPHGYLLSRRDNVVVIAGSKSAGVYYGAIRLLDEICGVRFYMPTDLFTSAPMPNPAVPAGFQRRVDPFARSAMMTGILPIPGDGGWAQRNGVARRLGGTHQHSMYAMFPPDRYATSHPEIYPILDGRRHIPASAADQAWQPCLSAAALVDVAEDSAIRYFRRNPQMDYVAFSVQDGHAVCQCDSCRAEYEKHRGEAADPREAEARGFSRLYWRFLRGLAERLAEKTPGKQVVGLVYGPARFPPDEKMPSNVVLFTNFHIAELEADRILTPESETGVSRLDYVTRRCRFYGNHDWYHGNGFLMPRIYSGYWSQYMRALADRVDGAAMHAEAYANWGLDGPKYYIVGRLWWEPGLDVGRLLRQFCEDLFGPAAEPMADYFTSLERLWITLDNVKGPERKLFQWNRQFTADADDLAAIRRCRELLDAAMSAAQTELQRQRIGLFSKTFVVPETLYRFAAADRVAVAEIEAFRAHVEREILPDPMTLYGAGSTPGMLRKNIDAALTWATRKPSAAGKSDNAP